MKNFKIINFSLIAIVMLVFASCTTKTKTVEFEKIQHYRHLLFTESPYDAIQGIHKISAEEAKSINNYKLTYDDEKRLVMVESCRDTMLLKKSRLGASKVLISYEENKEIRHYFDHLNEPKVVSGEVFKSVYELDESGSRIGLKFYGKDGEQIENRNKIAYYTWSKTPMGMIKENRYTLAGEETVLNEFCPFYELRFSYNENGRVARMANYEKDALYDCTAENCGNIGVSYFDFIMDENGGLLEFSVHSSTGQLSNLYWGWARFKLKLDENGYVIERESYDQDNELLGGKKVPITQYSYDEHGGVVEERYLDMNRQLMNNSKDVAVKQFTYDEFGNKSETVQFDKDMVQKEKS